MRYILVIFLFVNTIVSAEIKSYELIEIRNAQKCTFSIEENLVNESMKLFLWEKSKIMDSLEIPYVKNITDITVSQRSFLRVEFRRGGGSNVKMRYTSVFCAANLKIVTSISQINKLYSHVAETYVPEIDSVKGTKVLEDYSTSMDIQKLNKEYTANLAENYFYQSIFDPENNDKWSYFADLKFNNEQFIFYSGKREINGHFHIYYLNDSEEYKELKGEFWVVELKKFTYLWINSRWFYIDGDKLNEI